MARALSVDKSSSILWSEQQPRLVVSGLLISGVSRTMPPKLRGALMLGTAAVLCVVALSIYAEDKALDNVRSKRDNAQLKLDECRGTMQPYYAIAAHVPAQHADVQ